MKHKLLKLITLVSFSTLNLTSCSLFNKESIPSTSIDSSKSSTEETNSNFPQIDENLDNVVKLEQLINSDFSFYIYLENNECSLCQQIDEYVSTYIKEKDVYLLKIETAEFNSFKDKDLLNTMKEQLSDLTKYNFFLSLKVPTICYVQNKNVINAIVGNKSDNYSEFKQMLLSLKN